MKRIDAYRYTGSMQQLAYVRPCEFMDGRAAGLRAMDIKNAGMHFIVMCDKCLDIASLEYKGLQISFLSKPGLNGRNPFDTHGQEALRSIMGGLFFTCGLENICAPFTGSEEYPMHGRLRTTPAEHICSDACWDGDEYVLSVSGEMREAELFGENMLLRRSIRTVYASNKICICDEFENLAARPEPMMLLYHCNFGYPFLDAGAKLLLPVIDTQPREDWSGEHMKNWMRMEEPAANEREYVFLHKLAGGKNGESFAAIVNTALQIGVRIDFNRAQLPFFAEWKSIASGDYVLGLEPSNACVYGREYYEKQDTLPMLMPGEKKTIKWSFTILDGAAAIEQTRMAAELLSQNTKGN